MWSRQDQHIQQLFVVLARLAQQHSGCVERGLHKALATFDVVPATPRLGLLEFVKVWCCRKASAAPI